MMIGRCLAILCTAFVVLGVVYVSYQGRKVAPVSLDQNTRTPSPADQPISAPQLIFPSPGGTIVGPLVIRGYVPKSWTFEGQFRMQLLDSKRNIILDDRVPVEWDSENSKNTLYFVESYNFHTNAGSGFLILRNDNPSGLPENEKSTEIKVKFSPPPVNTVYLYQFDLEEDKRICDCTACQVTLPIPVTLGNTASPIKDTLNLLAGRMHPDFYVKSLNLKNGVLSVEFPHISGFTTGGSCAQMVNMLEVKKTALQFSEVKQVQILPRSMFQP